MIFPRTCEFARRKQRAGLLGLGASGEGFWIPFLRAAPRARRFYVVTYFRAFTQTQIADHIHHSTILRITNVDVKTDLWENY